MQRKGSLGSYILRTCIFAIPGAGMIGLIVALINHVSTQLFAMDLAISIAGGLILGIGIAAMNHRRFVRPIDSIVHYIGQVQGGHYEATMYKPKSSWLGGISPDWNHSSNIFVSCSMKRNTQVRHLQAKVRCSPVQPINYTRLPLVRPRLPPRSWNEPTAVMAM